MGVSGEMKESAVLEKGAGRMQITDVRVRKVAKEGKLKAVVSITLDEEFVVHDIKVIEGEKGHFIAMPSKKALDGEYRDIAHPINSGTRDRIQKIILERYEEALFGRTRGSLEARWYVRQHKNLSSWESVL